MKLTLDIANKIKKDFEHLIGQKVKTKEGEKEIKELVVLPVQDGSFGSFPFNYLLAPDKQEFMKPYIDKEVSLVIYLSDNSFIYFFQYLQDNNINLDWKKYEDE